MEVGGRCAPTSHMYNFIANRTPYILRPPVDLVGGSFGDYTILTTLGDDTMLVQRAAEAGFARLAIIRTLMPANHPRRDQAAALMRDARMAAQLQHPNVQQIHELGTAQRQLYVALEYLEGIAFDQLLRARGRDPALSDPRLFCALLSQACEGLHQGHSLASGPVIHGDLRPERLFITSGGTVKLLGLGLRPIAEAVATEEELASPERYAYASPEQVLGRPLTPRSDVFTAGVLAWEAITGRRLFSRPSRVEVLRAISEPQVVPPSALVPSTPAALDEAIRRALAPNPEDRFATARELAVALEEGVAERGAPLSTVAVAAGTEHWFGSELEAQRSLVLRARRELEELMSGGGPDDDFDVPTRLFNDDESDDALIAQELGLPGAAAPVAPAAASNPPEPLAPAPPPTPALSGPQFARPPDTLSGEDRNGNLRPPVDGSNPSTETEAAGRRRSGVALFLLLILVAGAGTAGYYLWRQYLAAEVEQTAGD